MNKFYIPKDPFQKYERIYRSLYTFKGFWGDNTALRFAAISAVTVNDDPRNVAANIKEIADYFEKRAGWFGDLNSSLRFVVAAVLFQNGDSPDAFYDEITHIRELFKKYDIRRGYSYEIMAALILRSNNQNRTIEESQIMKLKAIYEQMKKYHWWLTGPEDIPACAVLSGCPEAPEQIGERIERIYQALCDKQFSPGDELQNAANMLYLSAVDEKNLARRFFMLVQGFRNRGISIWKSDYEEIGLLAYLDEAQNDVIEKVIAMREKVKSLYPCPDASLSFNLACSLAFVDFCGHVSDMGDMAHAKALIDMQNVINAQMAAMAACCSASAASS